MNRVQKLTAENKRLKKRIRHLEEDLKEACDYLLILSGKKTIKATMKKALENLKKTTNTPN